MPQVEARIAKALAHPLRARILARLGERVSSPGDLAAELDAPLGVVAYHVRMLRDYECVELVRTEPRRGALQHFYKATASPDLPADQWRTLPAGLRKSLLGEQLQAIVDGVTAADKAPFNTTSIATVHVELDERGRRALERETRTYQARVRKLGESSDARGNDGRVRLSVSTVTFDQEQAAP